MSYNVQTCQVIARPLVATRDLATHEELSTKIPAKLGEVWAFIQSAGVKHDGQNVVIYWNVPGQDLINTPPGVPMDIGVGVLAPFTPAGSIISSATPAGTAATTLHLGPYEKLGDAHGAIHQWGNSNRREFAGPCWEIYGHWDSDPAKLRTDVFYLLK